jgi:poly-beta-1,6-N-acetyl-D-glucosamine N-deacetylase
MKKLFLLFFALPLYLFAEVHILLYHRFDDPRAKVGSMNIKSSELRAHFSYLKQNGYKVVKMSEVVDAIKNGKPIADKTVVLNIDDAYKTFYESGLKVFKEFGYPFTLFVYTDAVNHHYKDYMSWGEVREAAKYGEIGLHSQMHPNLTSLKVEDAKADTLMAFEYFTKEMGYKPKYYAYPFGLYNQAVKDAVAAFGFDAIVTVDGGAIDTYYDRLNLDRIALDSSKSIEKALAVKPLKMTIKTNQEGDKITVSGRLENSVSKVLHARIFKNIALETKVVNGEYSFSFDKSQLNSKRKVIFFTEDHRQATRLLNIK